MTRQTAAGYPRPGLALAIWAPRQGINAEQNHAAPARRRSTIICVSVARQLVSSRIRGAICLRKLVAYRVKSLGAAAPKTRTPGSAAVVEGHLVGVGVRERESAAERPVDGR